MTQKTITLLLALLLCLSAAGCAKEPPSQPLPSPPPADPGLPPPPEALIPEGPISVEETGDIFLQLLSLEAYHVAWELCGDDLQELLVSAQGLEQLWMELTQPFGDFLGNFGPAQVTDTHSFSPIWLGEHRLMMTLAIQDGKVIGFFLSVIQQAEDFLNHLLGEEYEAAFALFDPEMAEFFGSAEGLEERWGPLKEEAGDYISRETPYARFFETIVSYDYPAQFENGDYFLVVALGEEGVAGFYIRPADPENQ